LAQPTGIGIGTGYRAGLLKDLHQPHIERLRASYRDKRDAMLDAANSCLRGIPGVSWIEPAGGLYVWVTVPL